MSPPSDTLKSNSTKTDSDGTGMTCRVARDLTIKCARKFYRTVAFGNETMPLLMPESQMGINIDMT